MDQLTPVIDELTERTARLAMAAGAMRYLQDSTRSEEAGTVYTALDVLGILGRELDDSVTALRRSCEQLSRAVDDGVDVHLEQGCAAAYPLPGYRRMQIDLGEVRMTSGDPTTLDELMDCITQARAALKPEPAQAGPA
jgi:hypothetical protein